MEAGCSKGFGFVSNTSPEEANKAVMAMNGKIVITKPLYVAGTKQGGAPGSPHQELYGESGGSERWRLFYTQHSQGSSNIIM